MAESKRCAECGHTVSGRARFCELCGSPLREDEASGAGSARSSIAGERKQVTVMFVDIARSMELTRSLDTERWGVVLDRFLAIAHGAVDEFDGTANQFTGDGLMAVFGAPLASEDHAQRACLAALELHGRIAPFADALVESDGVEFAIRCGLSSGEVVVGSIGSALRLDFAPIGNISGLGQRMESLAPEGSTALSAPTAALVEGEFELRALGEFEVKGLGESQRVYELLGPGASGSRLDAVEPGDLSRFVGRDAEQATLDGGLERALAGEGRAVGIRGEAGVGKSRLVREFARHCRDRGVRVDATRADTHGRTAPLRPVFELLRAFLGVGESDESTVARRRIEAALRDLSPAFEPDLPLLLDFLGLSDPERPAERIDPEARRRRLFALVRGLVEARSRLEPAVIAIEDLHWLDAASADFVEELARAVAGTRTLLVATFRPEYEAAWTESPAYEELALAPLGSAASTRLLAELLGDDPSLDGLTEAIWTRTQGNPFFMEEVVRTLAESGRLVGDRGRYRLTGALDELLLPPTVQAVLGARIDRLGAREKELLQTMAVIGKEIDRAVLREVAGLERTELRDAVASLAAADFVVEGRGAGLREMSFTHPLTQEVAYASQLSEPRSDAHAAVAAAIERIHPDELDEWAAPLAHHSEAAGERLQAARWHVRAAVWVVNSSPAEALRHWHRVRALADEVERSPEADRLASSAPTAILTVAWRIGIAHEEAVAIYAEGRSRLKASGSTASGRGESSLDLILLDVAYATNLLTGGREREGFELLRTANADAEEIGDPVLVLVVGTARAFAAAILGFCQECVEAADGSLRLVGDDRAAGTRLGSGTYYANCLASRGVGLANLGAFDRALRDLDRALEVAAEFGDPEAECFSLVGRAWLRADMLEPQVALLDAERGAEIADRTGSNLSLVISHMGLARLRAECGDFDGARRAAERAAAVSSRHGTGLAWEPEILCHLAAARLGLGEKDLAREAAEEAVAIAERRSLKRAAVLARLGLGRVLMATEGVAGEAAIEEALRGALAMAAETGYRAIEPQIHLELATLAGLRGDRPRAESERAEAERLLAMCKAPEASVA